MYIVFMELNFLNTRFGRPCLFLLELNKSMLYYSSREKNIGRVRLNQVSYIFIMRSVKNENGRSSKSN